MRLLVLFLLFPFFCYSQSGTISGTVLTTDATAISGAKIFLNNSSYSTSSNPDGKFILTNVQPGSYELIAVAKGYHEGLLKITLGSGSTAAGNITLVKENIELKEVTISRLSKKDWSKYYNLFKDEFIGYNENSPYCTIENPDILDIRYDKSSNVVDVSSDEFLTVKNTALGINIKFLLKEFKMELNSGVTSYLGHVIFEVLPNAANVNNTPWVENRKKAYYGSPMHFYRTLSNGSLDSAGFQIFEIKREADKRSVVSGMEMLRIYANAQQQNKLNPDDLISKTELPDQFLLSFANNLFVIYKNPFIKTRPNIYPSPDLEFTLMSNINGDNRTTIQFDANGVVTGDPAIYQGAWSKLKLSKLLPRNYSPDQN